MRICALMSIFATMIVAREKKDVKELIASLDLAYHNDRCYFLTYADIEQVISLEHLTCTKNSDIMALHMIIIDQMTFL